MENRILARLRRPKNAPSGKPAGAHVNLQGRKTPKDAKMHAQNRLSTLSTDSTIPQKWMKNVRVFKGFWFWRTRYPQTYPPQGGTQLRLFSTPAKTCRRARRWVQGRRAAPSDECKVRLPKLNPRERLCRGQLRVQGTPAYLIAARDGGCKGEIKCAKKLTPRKSNKGKIL